MIEKRDWLLNTYAGLARLRPTVIERKHRLSADEFLDRHYAANWPVIITGAFADWPALQRWSIPYFRERFSERMVEAQVGRAADPDFELHCMTLRETVRFGDVLDHVERGPSNDVYLTARNSAAANGAALTELWDDLGLTKEYLTPGRHGHLWFGPAGTITPFHHDLTNLFMAQIVGRKRLLMAPAFAAPNIYNHNHVFSQVDGCSIDYEAFPLMQNVQVFECEIGPGDLLFVPIGWWHFVEALDVSATVTFNNFRWSNDHYSSYPGFVA